MSTIQLQTFSQSVRNLKTQQYTISAPTDPLQSGIYRWETKINIIPIPFISGLVALIEQSLVNDQSNLNIILAQSGYTGSVTIIKREIVWDWALYPISVGAVRIIYTIACTSPPLVALAPFIQWIAIAIIAVLAYLMISSIVSFLDKASGVSEYTPTKAGECASGYSYDPVRSTCVRTTPVLPQIPTWAIGLGAVALVLFGIGYVIKR